MLIVVNVLDKLGLSFYEEANARGTKRARTATTSQSSRILRAPFHRCSNHSPESLHRWYTVATYIVARSKQGTNAERSI